MQKHKGERSQRQLNLDIIFLIRSHLNPYMFWLMWL